MCGAVVRCRREARRGGDAVKARIFRLGVTVGSLLVVIYVLGAGKKW
jgi:hypothetical protein